jgi:hypothetical protein
MNILGGIKSRHLTTYFKLYSSLKYMLFTCSSGFSNQLIISSPLISFTFSLSVIPESYWLMFKQLMKWDILIFQIQAYGTFY